MYPDQYAKTDLTGNIDFTRAVAGLQRSFLDLHAGFK